MSKLQISKKIDNKSLQAFCDKVWALKPWSHNRLMAFYEYLEKQPTLAENETPIICLKCGDTTEAMLGFMKYFYNNLSVYSGINLYTLPELKNRGVHGIQLIQYWKNNCDIMLSIGPRKSTVKMYEKAKWTRVDTQHLRYFINWNSIIQLGKETHNILKCSSGFITYVKSQLLRPKRTHFHLEQTTQFDGDIDSHIEELKKVYRFLDRNSQLLNWRYFTFSRPGTTYEAFIMRGSHSNRIDGYFVLSIGETVIKVCELFAFPEYWEDLVICLKQQLTNYNKHYAVLETNLNDLVDVCQMNLFYHHKTTPNYFKTKKAASQIAADFSSKNFIISASDSDEYLL
jgi:hypothetical protein